MQIWVITQATPTLAAQMWAGRELAKWKALLVGGQYRSDPMICPAGRP